MSYFITDKPTKIFLDDEKIDYVEIKKLSWEEFQNSLPDESEPNAKIRRESNFKFIQNSIVGWNLKDDGNIEIPFTPENFMKLDMKILTFLIQEIRFKQYGLEKKSDKPSGITISKEQEPVTT